MANYDQHCLGCGVDTFKINHYYMVKHDIWRMVNPEIKGMLCIPCLEKRLGRELVAADFLNAPVNEMEALKCDLLYIRLYSVPA